MRRMGCRARAQPALGWEWMAKQAAGCTANHSVHGIPAMAKQVGCRLHLSLPRQCGHTRSTQGRDRTLPRCPECRRTQGCRLPGPRALRHSVPRTNAAAPLRPVGPTGLPARGHRRGRNAIQSIRSSCRLGWQFVGNVIDDVTNPNSTATSDSDAQRSLNTTALELVMHAHAFVHTALDGIGFVAACRW